MKALLDTHVLIDWMGDPADRVIVASAQLLGATVLTRDARIIQSRLVPTL